MTCSVLLTGGSGFIGQHLLDVLTNQQITVLGRTAVTGNAHRFVQADIHPATDFASALENIDVVIHCAARVHVMHEHSDNPLALYRQTNTAGTLKLAEQAAAAGVKRFIFLSSIKVNGEESKPDQPFRHDDKPKPSDPYSISKAEAELGLRQLAERTQMEIVIIRPPLVYGRGVKANFSAMMRLAQKNIPLPIGAINNKRSLVAADNLVDLIVTCISHPAAANEIFLVSDDEDVSTLQLMRMMKKVYGKTLYALPLPVSWLRFGAQLVGKKSVADRLCNSLHVDISHTKQILDWHPPVSLSTALQQIAEENN